MVGQGVLQSLFLVECGFIGSPIPRAHLENVINDSIFVAAEAMVTAGDTVLRDDAYDHKRRILWASATVALWTVSCLLLAYACLLQCSPDDSQPCPVSIDLGQQTQAYLFRKLNNREWQEYQVVFIPPELMQYLVGNIAHSGWKMYYRSDLLPDRADLREALAMKLALQWQTPDMWKCPGDFLTSYVGLADAALPCSFVSQSNMTDAFQTAMNQVFYGK